MKWTEYSSRSQQPRPVDIHLYAGDLAQDGHCVEMRIRSAGEPGTYWLHASVNLMRGPITVDDLDTLKLHWQYKAIEAMRQQLELFEAELDREAAREGRADDNEP